MKTARARLLRDSPLLSLLAGPASQLGILDPVESEERAFQASQFAKRGGDAVLPGMGGELAHDQRGRHGSAGDGSPDSQDIGPMRSDHGEIDAPGDQGFESWIGGRFLEAVEATVLQVGMRGENLKPSKAHSAKTRSESPPPSVWWRSTETSLW